MELNDEDLVLVEASPYPGVAAPPAETPPKKETLRRSIPPRPSLDEILEEDVAGEVLASIGAEASRVSTRSITPSTVPTPPSKKTIAPPRPAGDVADAGGASSASRLPSVSPPPFVRTQTAPYVRDSVPSIFARAALAADEPITEVLPSSSSMPAAAAQAKAPATAASVAPVALPRASAAEPTVILVRERPRTAWIVASAAIGAIVAFAATRVFDTSADATPAVAAPPPTSITTTLPAVIALPTAAVTAPPPVPATATATATATAATAAPPPAAVVKFGDDQGVAIPAAAAPPPAKPRAPKTAPRASTGPVLPDGSYGLGARTDSVRPAAPPEAAPKKPLTPEQQLAEAQLKASLR